MPTRAVNAMSTAYTSTDFGIAGAWLAEYTLDALAAGIVVFDSFGHMMQWNDRAPTILGLEPESMCGRSLGDLGWDVTDASGVRIPPGRCPASDVLRTGESVATTVHVPLVDGSRRAIAIRILPVFSHAGYTRGAIASLVPSDGIEPEDGFQPRNADHWASFEYSLSARLVVDPIGRIIDWNRQLLALSGYDDVSVADRRFEDICNLDLAWMWSSLEVANGEPMEGWISIRPAGGGPLLPVFGHFRLVGSIETGPAMSIELIDPTELQRPTERTTTLLGTEVFAAAAVPMIAITDAGEIVEANDAAGDLLGRPSSHLRQEPIGRFVEGMEGAELRTHVVAARRCPATVDAGVATVRQAGGADISADVLIRALRDGVRWPVLLVQLIPTA
jgi:PAS domain-containing protein